MSDAGFGYHGGATRAVGGDGAVVAIQIGAMHVSQAERARSRAGATNGYVAKAFNGAGDKFAVEAGADENGDIVVAEVPGAGEQATVPEGVDSRWGSVEAQWCAGVADVFEAEGHAQKTDCSAREARNYCEGEALREGVGGGHLIQFTCASVEGKRRWN